MALLHLIAYLSAYTGLSVSGLYFIKSSSSILSLTFGIGFTLYGSGFLLWLYLLKKMPLSLIFPLCSSSILIGTQVIGWLVLGENISLRTALAVVLSITACILLALEA